MSLILVYEDALGDMPYMALLATIPIVALVAGVKQLLKPIRKSPFVFPSGRFSSLDRFLTSSLRWLWFLIVMSWVMGVYIGYINGVETKYVFRNFFGLTLYLILPVLFLVRPTPQSLIRVVFWAGVIQMCFGLLTLFSTWMAGNNFARIQSSFSEGRAIYSTGFIVIFPLFTVSSAYQLLPKTLLSTYDDKLIARFSKSILFATLTAFALIVPALSKGYILSTLMLLIIIMFLSVLFAIRRRSIRVRFVILLMLSIIILLLLPRSFYEVIFYSFSLLEESNAVRAMQVHMLTSEFTILGNGLGSSLASGYARGNIGYGFELTYLNIIHKLGIFSIWLFISYIAVVSVSWIRIVRRIYVFESLFVLGSMGYLVVGAGNPILLSATSVVLHCIAMYILLYPYTFRSQHS